MRILHIIQRYWPAVGGAEIHLRMLSEQLAAEGHDVTVATTDAIDFESFWDSSPQRLNTSEECHQGVKIRRFPIHYLPVSRLSYPALRRLLWMLSSVSPVPTSMLERLSRFTPWVPDLEKWLRTTNQPFDLVAGMTVCFEPLLWTGLHFAQRCQIPFVAYPLTHLGAGQTPGDDPLSRFYTMRHQVALVQGSTASVMQTPTERDFYTKLGMPIEKLVVAGPGVNPNDLAGGDAERFRNQYQIHGPIIASISSMSYDKGTMQLVAAYQQLRRQGVVANLVLIGSVTPPFQNYWDKLTGDERQSIYLLGKVDEQAKRDLLAAMDLLVLPSRTDSFGIVYLEAWLYAKPVIGAKAWGIDDVIDAGKDGLLVPFGDAPALASAILDLLNDPLRRSFMGIHGREKAMLHTWKHKCQITSDLYRSLVEKAQPDHM